MVFRFGIFSGNVDRFPDLKLQPAGQASVESTNMFKFESSKVKTVTDLPLGQPTQPHANFTSQASSPYGSKIPLGVVPDTPGYRKLVELQRIFMTNDGKFVWQKLKADRPLYLLTVGLCAGGTLYSIYTLAVLSYKKA